MPKTNPQMRNHIIVVLLLLFSFTGFGQVSNNNKIEIGIKYSSIANYRTWETSWQTEIRNDFEERKLGNGVGIQIFLNLNHKYAITSGINIQQRGFKMIESYDQKTIVRKEEFNYITIPVEFVLKQNMGKIYIVESIGMKANFISSHKSNTSISDGINVETVTLANRIANYNITVSPVINIGIGIHLFETLDMEICPFFQHDINKVENTTPGLYLSDYGINFACKFKI